MNVRRYTQVVCFLIIFFSTSPLFCHWNEEFLKNSFRLSEQLSAFQNPKYLFLIEKYSSLRQSLESNSFLVKEIEDLDEKDKKNFPSINDRYIVKKRAQNNINEAYVWELSVLLSLDDYIVPTYPFELAHKHIVLQEYEDLTHGGVVSNPPLEITDRVSLEDYWKAHLLAYILGQTDLSGRNIGINAHSTIRLFDNEDTFCVNRAPYRDIYSFYVPFVTVAGDWTQYHKPLDADLAEKLNLMIDSLHKKKGDIAVYAKIRGLDKKQIIDLYDRIDTLALFEISEGTTFSDFFTFLYPQIADGLDDLCDIVRDIHGSKVDHGIALFFGSRMIRYSFPSYEQRRLLDEWIDRYVANEKQSILLAD